jgi:hypothetical protein
MDFDFPGDDLFNDGIKVNGLDRMFFIAVHVDILLSPYVPV